MKYAQIIEHLKSCGGLESLEVVSELENTQNQDDNNSPRNQSANQRYDPSLKDLTESGLRDINSENVRSLFDVSDNFIKEDWEEWINKTSLELLSKSPSIVLHSCSVRS
jgi:hypothetical protein